jgi:hypothetical protein
MPSEYFLGLDLARGSDFTALAILEQVGRGEQAVFDVRHLRRYDVGTSYPEILADLQGLLERQPLRYDPETLEVHSRTLAVDGTGVGRKVVEMFTEAGLSAEVILTPADTCIYNNRDGQGAARSWTTLRPAASTPSPGRASPCACAS